MRLKINRLAILILLLIFLTVQFSEGTLQDYRTTPTYGVIVPHGTDIFFECGAESGLQPPWDELRGSGGTGVFVSSAQARTGTKSQRHYVIPNPDDEYERRATAREGYKTGKTDFYFSFWVWFPSSDWNTACTSSNAKWHRLLQIKMYFGTSSNKYIYAQEVGWNIHGKYGSRNKPYLQAVWRWWYDSGIVDEKYASGAKTYYSAVGYIEDMADQWVHLQVHWKIAASGGQIRYWVDDVEKASHTNVITDPRGYASEWSNKAGYFASSNPDGNPYISLGMYTDYHCIGHTLYIDDVVWSDTKVPETQRVYA